LTSARMQHTNEAHVDFMLLPLLLRQERERTGCASEHA